MKVSPAPLPFQEPVLQVYLILSGTASQLTLQCRNHLFFSGLTSCRCRDCHIEGEYAKTKNVSTNYYDHSENSDVKIKHFVYICPFL